MGFLKNFARFVFGKPNPRRQKATWVRARIAVANTGMPISSLIYHANAGHISTRRRGRGWRLYRYEDVVKVAAKFQQRAVAIRVQHEPTAGCCNQQLSGARA